VIYEDEIKEKGDDFVACPHCGEKISKDDLEKGKKGTVLF